MLPSSRLAGSSRRFLCLFVSRRQERFLPGEAVHRFTQGVKAFLRSLQATVLDGAGELVGTAGPVGEKQVAGVDLAEGKGAQGCV